MILRIETHFDAAHYLPDYVGKCHNMHGHTYKLIIEIEGTKDSKTGMIEDFVTFKKFIQTQIVNKLDHHLINDIIPNPTAENISDWIKKIMLTKYQKVNVTVYEGIKNSVSTGW